MAINIMKFEKYGTIMGVVKGKEPGFKDNRDFLDFLMSAKEESQADIIIVEKVVIPEEFFDLKSGIAGEVNQKLVNYRTKMAIVGDFSGYESKALQDYIREANETGDLVFLRSINEAISHFAD